MANNADTTVIFTGKAETLHYLGKTLITTPKRGSHQKKTLNFTTINHLVPGLDDKELYLLLGCDYDSYLFAGNAPHMTQDEAKKWDEKVDAFLKHNGWVAKPGYFRNERLWDLQISEPNHHSLTMTMTFAWYCPFEFFKYHAEKNDVSVIVWEKLEGNYNQFLFWDEAENDYNYSCHTPELLMTNTSYRQACLDVGFLTPEQIYLVALYHNEEDVLKTYSPVDQAQLAKCAQEELSNLEDGSMLDSVFYDYKNHTYQLDNYIDWLKQFTRKEHKAMDDFSQINSNKKGLSKR